MNCIVTFYPDKLFFLRSSSCFRTVDFLSKPVKISVTIFDLEIQRRLGAMISMAGKIGNIAMNNTYLKLLLLLVYQMSEGA